MSIFSKLDGPVFVKDDSDAEKTLEVLKSLKDSGKYEGNEELEKDIINVLAGISGEKQIRFELENSHMPMYVIHDLFLEHNGLKAQIDYMVITRKCIFVLECKNLYGNIEINNNGDFIRSVNYGGKTVKEGIYSPITQNQRHMELIKEIRRSSKNIITKAFYDKIFEDGFKSVVVLANPKTVLFDRYAKKEVKDKVIRADQLIHHIKTVNDKSSSYVSSDSEMKEMADFFLQQNKENPVDYTSKYKDSQTSNEISTQTNKVICPKCGAEMVIRTAKKGSNAGNQFYGCSNYPSCKSILPI